MCERVALEHAICERGPPDHAVASEDHQNALFASESRQNAPLVARLGFWKSDLGRFSRGLSRSFVVLSK